MRTIQHTPETCPGRPCGSECDHKEFKPGPKPYNGHHCWNCWNVALWIGNDEGLYRAALECKSRPVPFYGIVTPTIAANRFLRYLGASNTDILRRRTSFQGARTPDGARYTFKAVKAALEGLE